MRKAIQQRGALGVVALALACTGCGKDRPVKVEGLVTLDGVPVGNATVLFAPIDGDSTRPSSGMTGSDGIFHLTTYATNDGVLPGQYKVVVLRAKGKVDFDTDMFANMSEENMHKMDIKVYEKIRRGRDKPKRSSDWSPLPVVYGKAETTPLICTVPTPDGKVALELGSKGGS
jgi:hypothetical protein